MNKVYIIRWEEETDSGEYFSGIGYVFDTLEKAQRKLKEIKEEEINYCEECDIDYKTENGNYGTLITTSDGYSKHRIEEREVE